MKGYHGPFRLVDMLEEEIRRERLRADKAETIKYELMTACLQALSCTPSVVVPSDGVPQIVYDCGDPWKILRSAIEKARRS